MHKLLPVVIGGGLGAGARYLVADWMLQRFGAAFPWGTLTVNLVGSILLGLIAQLGLSSGAMSVELRLLLTTGLMGGFTTYSTFNYETLKLLQEGRAGAAALNVALTLVGCLAGGALGVLGGRAVSG